MLIKDRDLHRRRYNLDVFHNPIILKRLLRLLMAVGFALPAFIFTEVIPDIPPFHHTFLRVVITVWFALLGYGLFPDLAKFISLQAISLINLFTNKISTAVADQIVRFPHSAPQSSNFTSHSTSRVSFNKPLILDTSAIIDGRILDIAKTNFLSGNILLPSFVLTELQQVSDSSDYIKRSRGRRGFEVVEELKKIKGLNLEVWEADPAAKTVDEKLIKLAKSLQGKIITTDFNLNKVATLSNVFVLNVNDLANAVKTVAIPGEQLKVKVVHLGKDAKQGVGYLPDGTMIVIEDGAELIGKEADTEVTRVIQVAAGRMIFTKSTH